MQYISLNIEIILILLFKISNLCSRKLYCFPLMWHLVDTPYPYWIYYISNTPSHILVVRIWICSWVLIWCFEDYILIVVFISFGWWLGLNFLRFSVEFIGLLGVCQNAQIVSFSFFFLLLLLLFFYLLLIFFLYIENDWVKTQNWNIETICQTSFERQSLVRVSVAMIICEQKWTHKIIRMGTMHWSTRPKPNPYFITIN